MVSSKLANNPLRNRDELARALVDLWSPVARRLEVGGAAVTLGANQASFGQPASSIESLARPLWGLAPLAAGGSDFDGWALLRDALREGVDPSHPHYWGDASDKSQFFVEMAPVAVALILAGDHLWKPLEKRDRANLLAWMSVVNRKAVPDNNWLFFRVLVNLAFERLGGPFDSDRMEADLDRMEQFYLRDGWYGDGPGGNRDYYVATGFHFPGLLYAKIRGETDPERAARFRKRAAEFAPQYAAWFAPDGPALPFGRSLTYRFVQAAFWGACAYADLPVLPWSKMKGIYLRHLRHWFAQPIFTETGLLTIGYGYPNLIAAEAYNSPGSPYWAFKAFLPLALPTDHPFWQAPEEEWEGPPVSVQKAIPSLVARDASREHVFALSGHDLPSGKLRFAAEKYAKFAYSAAFGFGVPVGGTSPEAGGADSMLLLTDDERDWRGRGALEARELNGGILYLWWRPWPDVEVETWLAVSLPGHVRIHRIRTARPLKSFEGGFALKRVWKDVEERSMEGGMAWIATGHGFSGLRDLSSGRRGEMIVPQPNTNLRWPLVSLPGLTGEHVSGEHWLVCSVAGLPGEKQEGVGRECLDDFSWEGGQLYRDGQVLIDCREGR